MPTSSDRVALTSRVESRMPSCAMTLAGCPILATRSRSFFSVTGRARRRSRMLSTERLDAPQTKIRLGLGLIEVSVASCLMISMSV